MPVGRPSWGLRNGASKASLGRAPAPIVRRPFTAAVGKSSSNSRQAGDVADRLTGTRPFASLGSGRPNVDGNRPESGRPRRSLRAGWGRMANHLGTSRSDCSFRRPAVRRAKATARMARVDPKAPTPRAVRVPVRYVRGLSFGAATPGTTVAVAPLDDCGPGPRSARGTPPPRIADMMAWENEVQSG